jgi:DNA-binding NarL/FixJ family response regulator
MIRVFLVDDHHIVRSGLHLLLSAQPDLEIVGEASNGLDLLAQLPSTPADVVLLDVNMPGMDGPETARQLHVHYPAMRILALSMLDKENHIFQMLDAGAHGYLLKSSGVDEIITGLRTVAAGGQFLCTAAGLTALHKLRDGARPAAAEAAEKPGTLSRREIAEKLFLSKRTIETHRQNMMEKMQVKNTASLIKQAMADGLLTD